MDERDDKHRAAIAAMKFETESLSSENKIVNRKINAIEKGNSYKMRKAVEIKYFYEAGDETLQGYHFLRI